MKHKEMSASFKISVITPSYNSGDYLEEAIQSVLIQNYPDFEHIVVDGGSTDNTLDILRKYDHLIWVSEPDKGQSDAMNKGFRMSTGDIIVYLNADDYFLTEAFNRVIPYFVNGSKFVVGTVLVKKDNGKSWLNDPKITHDKMLRHWEKSAFCVNPVGYFYLREVQELAAPFSNQNHFAMDLEFLLECSLKYSFTKVADKEPLGVFRYHQATKTAKKSEDIVALFTLENFNFIDKFLAHRSPEFIEEYNRARQIGYSKRISEFNNKVETKKSDLSPGKFKSFRKLNEFLQSGNKMKIIRQFVKRNLR
jgi:glycosyltransferase involved in cell wall biosynthesis